MNLEELKALPEEEMIKELKLGRATVQPKIEDVEASIDVKKHAIFDIAVRADKLIKADDGSTRVEPVARVGLALQKLIIKRAVAFLFGNKVEYQQVQEEEAGNADDAFTQFQKILKDVKINSFNRKVARDMFSCKEVAELWFPVPNKDPKAKPEDKFKLKVKKLSVLNGDNLYPYFDEFGDLIVFSREYIANKIKYFEIYTDEVIYKYNLSDGNTMVEGFPRVNEIGKIPIVYGVQEETAYEDVEELIARLEKVLSNFADTNDYHAAPKLFVKGTIKGFSKKGESGAIIEGDANTTVEYLSWNNAPEAIKIEIATLKEMIYTISQTPDISFESVKGLGGNAVSGRVLRFMFLDAHLKVMDNMETFDEYLARRTSVIKAFLSKFNTSLATSIESLEIEAIVTPYMLDDMQDKLEFVMTANGNKAVLSQETAISLSGLSDDVDAELKRIEKENTVSIFEPTNVD